MAEDNRQLNLPAREEKVLEFWDREHIFSESLKRTKNGTPFVFYEGPPTANGMPGIHHVLARVFKDVILRYKTMRGFFVPRKAGWDTHGLPVEIAVEKELGFKTKQDIERYGIAAFNKYARESVWKYKDEWERFTKRIGFWLDLAHPYITYETPYIESLWWIIKEIWQKGLLYEDFKIVPWCPRCQTALSSHEVGQGYKKIKEDSVYVKFRLKERKNEFLLVWTTTPWTLPANVAIAVNPKLEYTKYKITREKKYEWLWAAGTPSYADGEKIEVVEKVSGKSLLGLSYESLFSPPQEYSLGRKPEYITIAGDFVSSGEGTGMVHIAPAFGEEDMAVARAAWHDTYPILHTVNFDGTMKKGIVGEGKSVKDANTAIIEDLRKRKLLWRIEQYEHEYPFCWRCATPLLYFAKNAWWIKMSSLREKLLKNNDTVRWIPNHIKEGRFGEFLREIRDWAFSRERFWGTPLPIWRCDKCAHVEVVGSLQELSANVGVSYNRYLLMRHGESLANIKKLSATREGKYPLTLRGRMQVVRAAKKLRGVDMIVSSEIQRARETAEIIAETLGIKKIHFDTRLNEINIGSFAKRSPQEYNAYFSTTLEKFFRRPPEGESLRDVRARVINFLRDSEKQYSRKTILVVGHEYPLWMLAAGAAGMSDEETVALRSARTRKNEFIRFAEMVEVVVKNLPRDEEGEVNLHRPYTDEFSFPCKICHGVMRRVPEIADVWFDSGAMPYAQAHYPFATRNNNKSSSSQSLQYPADYICEAVDQTRGWFYTLLAIATLLGRAAPYKNVISLGLVLDHNGQKMSKSKGNVVDPDTMIQKYGADALRWYLYTINAPGESKHFDEKELFGKLRGFLMTLWNCFVLFDTYVDHAKISGNTIYAHTILDTWVLANLDFRISDVGKKLDSYDIIGAARAIEDFVINDFSQWYLRRSRRRFQRPEFKKDKDEAAEITAYVLLTVTKLLAPFTPFFAEILYQELRKKLNIKEHSVHLFDWPRPMAHSGLKKQQEILKEGMVVREVVAAILKLRATAGIKVRQPLASVQLNYPQLRDTQEWLEIIKEEVNVKKITFGGELTLDTVITSKLKEEGMWREVIRNIQEMRKDFGLKPGDKIRVQFSGEPTLQELLSRGQKMIMTDTNAREYVIGGKKLFRAERELALDDNELWIGISPVKD